MKRYLAFLVFGVIIGASTMNLFTGDKFDRMYREREELKVQHFELTDRLKKLEAQLATHHNPVVKEIKIEFEDEKESLEELSLRQVLNELAREIIGEEIESISPMMVHRLFHERYVQTGNGKVFQVYVNWFIISEQAIFNLRYEPVPAPS